jgi:hypothetical protein
LPPHERTWRHPSELAPTRTDVETGSHHHLAALTFGALAMFAVVTMMVAMTPRTVPGDDALSSTTAPVTTGAVSDDGATNGAVVRTVRSDRTTTPLATIPPDAGSATGVPVAALLTSFTSFPHAVMSSPPLTLDGTGVAATLPRSDDIVYVHTDAVTYRLPWGHVPSLAPPDGSVVFDADNSVVAIVDDGQLLMVADD